MQRKYIVTALIALAVVILFLVWLVVFILQLTRPNQVIAPQSQTTTPNSKSTTDTSLGGQIYQQTQNPLQKKLPDTNPVKNANPIQGAYTNPF